MLVPQPASTRWVRTGTTTRCRHEFMPSGFHMGVSLIIFLHMNIKTYIYIYIYI